MCHQLIRDLLRKPRIEAATGIDRREFPVFALVVGPKFVTLQIEVGLLGVGL